MSTYYAAHFVKKHDFMKYLYINYNTMMSQGDVIMTYDVMYSIKHGTRSDVLLEYLICYEWINA